MFSGQKHPELSIPGKERGTFLHVYHLSSEGTEQICFLTRDTSIILGASGYLLFSSFAELQA